MYPLLPYRRISIDTSLTVDEAVTILSDAIMPQRSFRRLLLLPFAKSEKEFEGEVSDTGSWKISRAIRYRNSFLPILYGIFVPTEQGVRVEVRMIMHLEVIVFLLGFALIGIGLLPKLGSFVWSVENIVMLSGMILLPYLMVFEGFGYEASKAERFIRQLFEPYQAA